MPRYSLRHLADSTLRDDLKALVARERRLTTEVLAHIAEFDDRRLYLEDGYASMYAYCVGDLGFSEDETCKRISAARAARRFPVIFAMIEDGRLHLSGLVTLAPHLIEGNADEILAAASNQTRKAIEQMLAERFPRPDLPTVLEALSTSVSVSLSDNSSAPGRMTNSIAVTESVEPVTSMGGGALVSVEPRPRITPLAPERFALQTTIDQETSELIREAQELLGHVGSSHVPNVLKTALRLYVERLRKQKFGATNSPRPGRQRNPDSRHISEETKRAVWHRDGGQCAFVSESGHRCEERSGLEYDHIVPYARGGDASSSNVRVLCQAHNQHEAERTYGAEFMRSKREAKRAAGAG